LLAIAIALSRVYLGVHFPADSVGGALLGLAVGALVIWMRQRLATSD
jgi:membrane-associated phospholipid phosphatase